MIQVIERAFGVLEFLSAEGEASLKEISDSVGLKNTTVSNILRSLIDLGYMEKDDRNRYRLSKQFHVLAETDRNRLVLHRTAATYARMVSDRIHEPTVIAEARGGRYYVIAEAMYDQAVTVNTSFLQSGSFYNRVTGKVLLAFMDTAMYRQILARDGLPGDEWPEAGSVDDLEKVLDKIRGNSLAELRTDQVYAVGVPVLDEGGRIVCSMGVYVPVGRGTRENRKKIVAALKDGAALFALEFERAS